MDHEGGGAMVGRMIADGRYEILRLLGEGGMGVVYEARQVAMDRKVALKLIRPSAVRSSIASRRFRREMRITTRLEHPNTVRVYDFGESDGRLFLTMELLRGLTLRQVLDADGPLPLPRIAHIAGQILHALDAAHGEGIVHRDLKPDNVMLIEQYGERDVVKVVDFGIAKLFDDEGAVTTPAGNIVGTPAYLSPEQALGNSGDARIDLYALGVMLYEMSAGCVPFTGRSVGGLLVAHASEPPPRLAEVAPATDPGLVALVMALLEKDPAARPQTAKEVEARLVALAQAIPASAIDAATQGAAESGAVNRPGAGASWLHLLRRREVVGGTATLLLAYLFRDDLFELARSLSDPASGDTSTVPTPGPDPTWPMAVGIMEIKAGHGVPVWMCDMMHKGLNAFLGKFDRLNVVSRVMIDWLREKTGRDSLELAHELKIARMISGELDRSNGKLVLQVFIVDTAGGYERTCEANGSEDQFVAIQNDVGVQILAALKLPVTKAEVDRVLAARTSVDLDVNKRFADAFGQGEAAPTREVPPGARWLSWPAEAYAQSPAEETAVKLLLERYRAALEAKSVDRLTGIYMGLSSTTREALDRYFQNATDLKVQFSNISVLFQGDEALATFTRNDQFKDVQTGQDVTLEVRVSTVVAKEDGEWKIKSLS